MKISATYSQLWFADMPPEFGNIYQNFSSFQCPCGVPLIISFTSSTPSYTHFSFLLQIILTKHQSAEFLLGLGTVGQWYFSRR